MQSFVHDQFHSQSTNFSEHKQDSINSDYVKWNVKPDCYECFPIHTHGHTHSWTEYTNGKALEVKRWNKSSLLIASKPRLKAL